MDGRALSRATGVDPLTISQTPCLAPGATPVAVLPQAERYRGTEDFVPPVDMFVGHPGMTYRDHRPTWRREIGDRDVAIPASLRPDAEMVIVEARDMNQPDSAVPMDAVLARPGEDIPLLLPPGRYRLSAYTKGGPIIAGPVIAEVED